VCFIRVYGVHLSVTQIVFLSPLLNNIKTNLCFSNFLAAELCRLHGIKFQQKFASGIYFNLIAVQYSARLVAKMLKLIDSFQFYLYRN